MKIAISSTEEGLESQVDAKFGRCPYFVVVEIENKKIKSEKTIKNTASAQFGGAGVTAAQIIANEKVDAIITQNLGPRALGVFQQLGIEIYQGSGRIKDAVQQFIDGKLKKISAATSAMGTGKFGKGL